jgi:hypothetical protein
MWMMFGQQPCNLVGVGEAGPAVLLYCLALLVRKMVFLQVRNSLRWLIHLCTVRLLAMLLLTTKAAAVLLAG